MGGSCRWSDVVPLVFVLGASAVLFLGAEDARASHVAGGTLAATAVDATTTRFDLELSLRASFYAAQPGDVIVSGAAPGIDAGDGQQIPFDLLVVARDDAKDHLVAVAVPPGANASTPGLLHTFDAVGAYTAAYETCCRVANAGGWIHVNNPDTLFRLETRFDLDGSTPPPWVPLLVSCRLGDECRVPLPAGDGPVPVRFATGAETGAADFRQPGPPHAPAAARIEDGSLVWNTTNAFGYGDRATMYSVQVVFGAADRTASAAFTLRLESEAPRPVFRSPSPCGRTLLAAPREPLRALLHAEGGTSFALVAHQAPAGAAFQTSRDTAPVANLTWTPGPQDRGLHRVVVGTQTRDAVCLFQVEVVQGCSQVPAACTDSDGDGWSDANDVCPADADSFQEDWDLDGDGDACTDTDGDGRLDGHDNCPGAANPGQQDMDGDLVGDVCDMDIDGDGVSNRIDNCDTASNPSQSNTDHDPPGDACDPDLDGDGFLNADDNCPGTYNPTQRDLDGDGAGDACDPGFTVGPCSVNTVVAEAWTDPIGAVVPTCDLTG